MRSRLFELEDQKWIPDFLRQSMTDYLRYFLGVTNFYKPTTTILAECLKTTGDNRCIDLCSGGGGAVESVIKNLKQEENLDVRFLLTDKFPNVQAFSFLKTRNPANIGWCNSSVDAMDVPGNLVGVRTMYSAIHHFNPESVKKILQNAVESRSQITIFDGGDKNILTILGIIIFHPIAFFLLTPFFKPFKISRLLFTYIIPLIPICTIWDGVVSIIRLYTPDELIRLARQTESDYDWKSCKVKNSLGMNVVYLTGSPKTTPLKSTVI